MLYTELKRGEMKTEKNLEGSAEEETLEETLPIEGEGDESEKEVPLFMQEEDEQESSDGVPVAAHIKMKQKLKGKLRDSDSEIERLKAENEKLKSSTATPEITVPKRPKLDDFDTDEEYDAAATKYEKDNAQAIYAAIQKEESSKSSQRKFVERVQSSVDGHYDRAAKLVEKHGINPEVYRQATETVQEAIETVVPGMKAFDLFVDLIGEGSEKTVFAVGRNKTKLSLLKEKLHDDRSGLKAAFYLGQETARLNGIKNKSSSAPAPAAQLKGDAKPESASTKALKKKYDEAHSKGRSGEAYKLKKQARLAGADTKSWS